MHLRLQRAFLVPLIALVALLAGVFATSATAAQSGSFSRVKFNLGEVPVGDTVVRTTQLTSTGTEPLQLLYIDSGANGGDISLFSPFSDGLAPGATRDFTLAVRPMMVGSVDQTLQVYFGDAETQTSIPVRVTYTAVAPPELPFEHFDLRLDDSLWISMIGSDYALRSIGDATGRTPGPFVFPVASGAIAPDNTGVVSSDGGLGLNGELRWKRLGLDLDSRHLTAAVVGSGRVAVADLNEIYDSYDLLGNPTTAATVYLTQAGSDMLNATGLQPQTTAGQYIGFIEIRKP